MRERLAAWLHRLVRITEGLSAALIAFIVICNATQIFCRYVLVSPLSWTDEAMRFSMVWVAFLTGSALVFRREHMALDMFGALGRLRIVLQAVVLLAVGAFAIVLTINGWPLALRNAAQLSPSAQIPMIVPYIAVPVGGALIVLYAAALLIMPGRVSDIVETDTIDIAGA